MGLVAPLGLVMFVALVPILVVVLLVVLVVRVGVPTVMAVAFIVLLVTRVPRHDEREICATRRLSASSSARGRAGEE